MKKNLPGEIQALKSEFEDEGVTVPEVREIKEAEADVSPVKSDNLPTTPGDEKVRGLVFLCLVSFLGERRIIRGGRIEQYETMNGHYLES